jgi:hypothetical protein
VADEEPATAAAAPSPARPFAATTAAALIAVLILAPTLAYPFGRDQSVFAFVGRVIAEGGMPYRDAWDLKPPGIYVAYAAVAALVRDAGALMVAVRWLDVGLAALTGVLLVALCGRLRAPEAGMAAAAWYAALYLQGGFWSLAQAEAWANPLMLAALLLALSDRRRRWFGVGLLAGAAALFKFTAALPVLPCLWLAARGPGGARAAAALISGGALPLLAAGGWLAAGGAWEPYLEIQRGFVAPYTRLLAGTPGQRLAVLAAGLGGFALRYWGALLLCGGLVRKAEAAEPPTPAAPVLLAAGLLAAAGVVVQGKFFLYHWTPVLPFLALGAAAGSRRLAGGRGWVILLLPCLWTLVGSGEAYRGAAARVVGALPAAEWDARFNSGADYAHDETVRAAARVRSLTRPGDSVLVWGFEPNLYLLADRRPPTRFFFNVPVAAPWTPTAWRYEFLRDLEANPPALIAVLRRDAIPWANGLPGDSAAQLAAWPELAAWVEGGYQEVAAEGDFTFLARRQAAGGSQ